MEDILKQILSELKDLKNDVNSLKSGQERLEQRFDGIEKDVKELKNGQVKTRDDIINKLGEYVEKVVTHIDNKVDDQQIIIDTLSSRSIKHESEINDFKKILKNQ